MNVIELFKMGGMLFMVTITILAVAMIYISVKSCINVFVKKDYSGAGVNYILLFGSLAVTIGFLAQAIGLFQAFSAIQRAADISPAIVAGGIKVSMITPLFGSFIFIISLPIWFVLREKIKMTKND